MPEFFVVAHRFLRLCRGPIAGLLTDLDVQEVRLLSQVILAPVTTHYMANTGYTPLQVPAQSWFASCLAVRQSPIDGLGVFTNEPISAGTVVIRWGGRVFTADEIHRGLAQQHSFVSLDEHTYVGSLVGDSLNVDDYLNHSCHPNLWMEDAISLAAMRDIQSGEELTADYAMWLSDESYRMKRECHCGAADCRALITGRDWRDVTLQRRYAGHFSPFLEARFKARSSIADTGGL